MTSSAVAHANIALVKYWGKRDSQLNLPAVGSISMTLEALTTRTSVEFLATLSADQLVLNGQPADSEQTARVSRFLDLIRRDAHLSLPARVDSENNFPTAAGLASSASGFAALAMAAAHAAGLEPSPARLSEYARLGSGSAARSIFGGFVEMKKGRRKDGADAIASQLYDERYWPLELLICITSEGPKKIGSTRGMNLTAETSPYYSAWITSANADLTAMREALAEKDFQKLGEVSEHSCLKMHGLALSAQPGLLYWNETTITLIHEIRRLRSQGTPLYFTIDAGPQVKAICPPGEGQRIKKLLEQVKGVQEIIHSSLGPGVHVT